jgi:hypothetical protein
MWQAEIPVTASDPDAALRTLAGSYRDFVKSCDKLDRVTLGLPRANRTIDMGLGRPVNRHPTTVHLHLAQGGDCFVLRMAGFQIARLVDGTEFFRDMETALRRSLGSASPGSGGSPPRDRRRPAPSADGRPQTPAAQRSAPLLFRAGQRVRNKDGETGTVVSDVRIGETEMMVRIDGDLYPERVGEWIKI